MKALLTMLVAAGFMLAMSVAQAGVPAVPPTPTQAANTPAQQTNDHQNAPPNANPNGAPAPTIPGAQQAQQSATSHGKELAVIGGVLAAVLVVAIAGSGGGGDHAANGGTGTTGTR